MYKFYTNYLSDTKWIPKKKLNKQETCFVCLYCQFTQIITSLFCRSWNPHPRSHYINLFSDSKSLSRSVQIKRYRYLFLASRSLHKVIIAGRYHRIESCFLSCFSCWRNSYTRIINLSCTHPFARFIQHSALSCFQKPDESCTLQSE